MKDTNQIEKAITKKAIVELEEVVDKFRVDLEKLNEKYGGGYYFDILYPDGEPVKGFSCSKIRDITDLLLRSMTKKYLPNMVSKKVKELLAKMELI
jgi:hypothetical protein